VQFGPVSQLEQLHIVSKKPLGFGFETLQSHQAYNRFTLKSVYK